MKKLALIALLISAAWSVDFSKMSTEELVKLRGTLPISERFAFRAEMRKRMQAMSPQERQKFRQNIRQNIGMGKGLNKGNSNKGMGKSQKGMQNRPNFKNFDLNNDGKITKKEFYNARTTRMTQRANEGKQMKNAGNAPTFEAIDSNSDGVISQSEFNAFRMQKMQAKKK